MGRSDYITENSTMCSCLAGINIGDIMENNSLIISAKDYIEAKIIQTRKKI